MTYLEKSLRSPGFTMIEVVIVLAIITAVSVVVLFSFTGLNEGAALNRATRELALAIRKAQNMSLAVTQISTQAGPTIPPAVGVRLSTLDPTKYFLFADLDPRDNKYRDPPDAKITGGETIFERGIKINSLKDPSGTARDTVHIILAAPEATLTLADSNGVTISGDRVEIELITPSRQTKKVVVRISGQVSIK